jgi:twitching motility protein PilT
LAETITLKTYRLRKIALSMRVFTIANLATAARVTNQTAKSFLSILRRENLQFLDVDTWPAWNRGRPLNRYTLTPKGISHLSALNAPFDRDFNGEAPRDLSREVNPFLDNQVILRVPRLETWLLTTLPKFQEQIDRGASTFLIKPNEAGLARFEDQCNPSRNQYVWSLDEVDDAVQILLNPRQRERLAQRGWSAYSHASRSCKPIKISVKSSGEQSVVELAFLPTRIPSLEDFNLTPFTEELCRRKHGLIVVTGLAGSGMSAVMAALIDYSNSKFPGHITTVEEPMNYILPSRQAFTEQRQIAIDVPDYSPAIEQALAAHSTVISVSEVPDRASFLTLLSASTRSMVLCRVPATSGPESIRKLLSLLPQDDQTSARKRLVHSLAAILRVASLPGSEGHDVPATEVLCWRPEAGHVITTPDKLYQLENELRSVHAPLYTMASAVLKLRYKGLISQDTADIWHKLEVST